MRWLTNTGDQMLEAGMPAEDGRAPSAGRRPRLARALRRAGLLPWIGRLRTALRDDVRILAYHRVLDAAEPADFRFDPELISASREAFREQLAILARRWSPIRFDELAERLARGRRAPRRAVLITFDDGYDDNHRIAYPLLREAGLSAMFFVSTGHIDSGRPYAYDWLVHMLCVTGADRLRAPELGIDWPLPADLAARRDLAGRTLDRIKTLSAEDQEALIARLQREWSLPADAGHRDCRPMTWAQLREMREGGMEIGSHGVHHRMLAKLPAARMRAELVDSKAAIEREIGCEAIALSYPVGGSDAYDASVMDAAREAGYLFGCSYLAGPEPLRAAAHHELRRVPVERQMDADWFEGTLALPELFCYRSRTRVG
jgi:peptidoglycan/xylan/chitin deacetylase (PgdA/CDA1 family)